MSTLFFYNNTEILYFEIQTMDEAMPAYKLVLDFILGHGGVF
jgi:hypothetical protein